MSHLVPPVPLPHGVAVGYLHQHRVCPVASDSPDGLHLLVAPDALLADALSELSAAFGRQLVPIPSDLPSVRRAIAAYGSDERDDGPTADEEHADLRDLAQQPPVVRFVNSLLRDAVTARASDIHLEAARDNAVARLRIDGVLVPTLAPGPDIRAAVLSRVKLLADMDIAERRTAQDGSLRIRLDAGQIDVRVSSVPTLHGESIVLRLLNSVDRPTSTHELGMNTDMHSAFVASTQRTQGLLLVTGPTGSGKTTTLYAALQSRDISAEKIVTVEDPIEYELEGITQVPVNARSLLSFSDVLRSILRQDPDVLMIGEMRDAETASLALRSALTGHFVLSTLHTTDATSAVTRLLDLGIPAFLIGATLQGVLAQRLVRRICPHCTERRAPSAVELPVLQRAGISIESVRSGRGCDDCNHTGFRGRLGLFEFFQPSDAFKDALIASADRATLRAIADTDRLGSLWSEGVGKVRTGETTIMEVLRAVQQ